MALAASASAERELARCMGSHTLTRGSLNTLEDDLGDFKRDFIVSKYRTIYYPRLGSAVSRCFTSISSSTPELELERMSLEAVERDFNAGTTSTSMVPPAPAPGDPRATRDRAQGAGELKGLLSSTFSCAGCEEDEGR